MCIVCGTGPASGVNFVNPSAANDGSLSGHPGLSPALSALVTQLEPENAVAPVGFDILNSAGATQAELDAITAMLTAAWNVWAAVLSTESAPTIRLEILSQTISGRFQGGAASSVTSFTTANGLIVGQPVFNQELQTGVNTNGAGNDFLIQVNLDYFRNTLFMDTTLSTSNDIPNNRTDAFSVMVHEMGHALGFNGYGPSNTGAFRSFYDYRSTYDANGISYFSGPNVSALLGGALPLTTGNTAHYGNSTGIGSNLVAGYLMNGVVFTNGFRYSIGALDLAVLEDMGLPSIRDAIYDQTWLTAINGGAGIDTFLADYGSRATAVNITLNETSFTAPSSLPANQAQTITLRNIERLTVTTGSGNDTLTGGAYVDTLGGGAGNDILRGNGGNDVLDGGSGFDAALYSGGRRQYTASSTSVSGNGEGADTLIGIEEARFIDGVLTFEASSASAQVMRLYSATLNRTPDQGGLEANVSNLARLGIEGLANLFVASAEFQARFGALNNQQFVEQMYRFALGREGDAAGISHWVGVMNGGATRGQMVVAFSESVEHQNRTAGTLNAGLWIPDLQAQMIARMYDATFDRLPDPGGLGVWTANLKAGMSMLTIATAFAGSAEFTARYGAVTNEQFIRQMYQFCLNREPDAAGLATWVAALNSGTSRAQMLLNFSESAEHIGLTAASWLGGVRFAGSAGSPLEMDGKATVGPQILPDELYTPADLDPVSFDGGDDAFVLDDASYDLPVGPSDRDFGEALAMADVVDAPVLDVGGIMDIPALILTDDAVNPLHRHAVLEQAWA